MKQFLVSQLILIAIILPSDSLGRNWTDLKGRSLEGELLSCDEKQITIKRLSDQKEYLTPNLPPTPRSSESSAVRKETSP